MKDEDCYVRERARNSRLEDGKRRTNNKLTLILKAEEKKHEKGKRITKKMGHERNRAKRLAILAPSMEIALRLKSSGMSMTPLALQPPALLLNLVSLAHLVYLLSLVCLEPS